MGGEFDSKGEKIIWDHYGETKISRKDSFKGTTIRWAKDLIEDISGECLIVFFANRLKASGKNHSSIWIANILCITPPPTPTKLSDDEVLVACMRKNSGETKSCSRMLWYSCFLINGVKFST